jgi:ATP-dependent DNA ligase
MDMAKRKTGTGKTGRSWSKPGDEIAGKKEKVKDPTLSLEQHEREGWGTGEAALKRKNSPTSAKGGQIWATKSDGGKLGTKSKSKTKKEEAHLEDGAVAAEELGQSFPEIALPVRPPYPPMEAKSVDAIPSGKNWQYEPKFDGFRCLAFRKGKEVLLQSKAGQPLGRYFPELVDALGALETKQFVIDGEIVIGRGGHFSFEELLMRIHPAASRIKKLSAETPSTYLVFDLLVDEEGKSLVDRPLSERRQRLEQFIARYNSSAIRLAPATLSYEVAEKWMKTLSPSGFDGVIAKELDRAYASGERTAMQKIKRIRTADCVVGGFRWASKGGEVGSLLLGLYNDEGQLDHIGFSSSFNAERRAELKKVLKPYMGGEGFTGKAPGGPSRWSTGRSGEWERLDPKLVCEVQYDHFSGGRFRHGTKFLRWRPDKKAQSCTFEQVTKGQGTVEDLFAA